MHVDSNTAISVGVQNDSAGVQYDSVGVQCDFIVEAIVQCRSMFDHEVQTDTDGKHMQDMDNANHSTSEHIVQSSLHHEDNFNEQYDARFSIPISFHADYIFIPAGLRWICTIIDHLQR